MFVQCTAVVIHRARPPGILAEKETDSL